MKDEHVAELIGYKKFDIVRESDLIWEMLSDEYTEGILIDVLDDITDNIPSNCYHAISSEKLKEIISNTRDHNIDSIVNEKIERPLLPLFKHKVGDPVYHEAEVKYIVSMHDDRVTEVNDGIGGVSSYDLSETCFDISPISSKSSSNIIFWWKWLSEYKFQTEKDGYQISHSELSPMVYYYWGKSITTDYEKYNNIINDLFERVLNSLKKREYGLVIEGVKIFKEYRKTSE